MIYKYSDYIDRCDKDFQHKEEGEVSKIEQIMKECSAKIFKVIDRWKYYIQDFLQRRMN